MYHDAYEFQKGPELQNVRNRKRGLFYRKDPVTVIVGVHFNNS